MEANIGESTKGTQITHWEYYTTIINVEQKYKWDKQGKPIETLGNEKTNKYAKTDDARLWPALNP